MWAFSNYDGLHFVLLKFNAKHFTKNPEEIKTEHETNFQIQTFSIQIALSRNLVTTVIKIVFKPKKKMKSNQCFKNKHSK